MSTTTNFLASLLMAWFSGGMTFEKNATMEQWADTFNDADLSLLPSSLRNTKEGIEHVKRHRLHSILWNKPPLPGTLHQWKPSRGIYEVLAAAGRVIDLDGEQLNAGWLRGMVPAASTAISAAKPVLEWLARRLIGPVFSKPLLQHECFDNLHAAAQQEHIRNGAPMFILNWPSISVGDEIVLVPEENLIIEWFTLS